MPENYRRRIPEAHLEGHKLGRHVNHDPRSLNFKVHPAGLIATVLWDRKIPVLDQGNLGSCTGNAAVGAIGTLPGWAALQPQQQAKLNEQEAVFIYSAATVLDNYPGNYPPTDTGSDGLSVAKAAKSAGLISGYLHATSIAAMNTALQTGPVIVGVNWYEGMDSPDSQGRVRLTGLVRGGHEFEVLGYDVAADLYTAVNSWGESYGLAGRFKIAGPDMARLLAEDGDCTQLLPLSVPAPVPTGDPNDTALWAATKDWAAARHVTSNRRAAQAVTAWAHTKGFI